MFASLSLPVTLLKQVAFFFYFVDACVVYDFFCGFFSLRFFVVFSFWFALWWFLVVPSFSPFTVLLPRTLCLTLCHSCHYNPTLPPVPKKHPPPSEVNPRDRRIPIPVSIENQRRSPLHLAPFRPHPVPETANDSQRPPHSLKRVE